MLSRSATLLLVSLLTAFTPPVSAQGNAIYWAGTPDDSDLLAILRTNLDGSGREETLAELVKERRHSATRVVSVAVDTVKRRIYWASRTGGDDEIWRAELDGSGAELFWHAPGGFLSGLAIHAVDRSMFFGHDGVLRRIGLDDRVAIDLVEEANPSHIAVDPIHSRLFWVARVPPDVQPGGQAIWSSNLVGEDVHVVLGPSTLGRGLTGDLGLALDPVGGKVYWTAVETIDCKFAQRIRRANLDGGEIEDIICVELGLDDYPSKLAVDAVRGKAYWANDEIGNLFSVDLASRENELVSRGAFAAFALGPLESSVGFRRADANADGTVDISDPILSLTFQFVGVDDQGIPVTLACADAADVDDNGLIDISDPILNLTFQFLGMDPDGDPIAIPPPGTESCGVDPTEDDLRCESYTACGGEAEGPGG